MRKLLFLTVCAAAVFGLSSCNNAKKRSAGESAKSYHENVMKGNYNAYVDNVMYDKSLSADNVRRERAEDVRLIRTRMEENTASKGGVKDVKIISENVAPSGNTAEVRLRTTYDNGSTEDVIYNMAKDDDVWKVKMGNDKEVWKVVTANGTQETFKLKSNDNKVVLKENVDGERNFIKEKETENGEVLKVKEDGQKTVVRTRNTSNGDVTSVKTSGNRNTNRQNQANRNQNQVSANRNQNTSASRTTSNNMNSSSSNANISNHVPATSTVVAAVNAREIQAEAPAAMAASANEDYTMKVRETEDKFVAKTNTENERDVLKINDNTNQVTAKHIEDAQNREVMKLNEETGDYKLVTVEDGNRTVYRDNIYEDDNRGFTTTARVEREMRRLKNRANNVIDRINNEDNKEILRERRTDNRNVIVFKERGERGYVKEREYPRRQVARKKEDGIKDVVKIKDRKKEAVIVTVHDGDRERQRVPKAQY